MVVVMQSGLMSGCSVVNHINHPLHRWLVNRFHYSGLQELRPLEAGLQFPVSQMETTRNVCPSPGGRC